MNTTIPVLTALEVAEDYRHQRQAAEARRSGFQALGRSALLNWLEANNNQLIQMALDNGASIAEAPGLVEEYKSLITTAPSGSDFDDLNIQLILRRLGRELIKRAAIGGWQQA